MKTRDIIINQPRSSYFVGGAELVSLEHAKQLEKSGHNVTFSTISPDTVDMGYSPQYERLKNEDNNIRFIELEQPDNARDLYHIEPGENRDRWNVESMHYNSSLFEYIYSNDEGYDAMLSYYKFDALVVTRKKIASNALYLCGIPKESNEFMSSFLAMYDNVATITNETKSYWQRYYQKDIPVVPSGVDTEKFRPILNESGKTNITFIGRLIERKGCDLFIKALNELSDEELGKIHISIVGDGPQASKLRILAAPLTAKTDIVFTGSVDSPEKILGQSDVCVLPSRRGEGLQGVLLEAMACGNHVVASHSAINDRVLGSSRGTMVDVENTESLANAIRQAIDNKDGSDIPLRARSYVEDNFKWSTVTNRLLEEVTK